MTNPTRPEAWNQFLAIAPYTGLLNMEAVSAADAGCVIALPYREDLIGDPDRGVLHGGAITALMDVCFGFSVYFRIREFVPMATLDLRIDYLRPAQPHSKVYASASCYKLTQELAFVRGHAYDEDPEQPISTGVGIFILTSGKPAFTEQKVVSA
ncbi:PaaI family thioesterase [Algiphilus sp. W345]|uniref:PaaI family thioesterase n=1 Tax=Banduia mediterranea TaxID=3075609 RepID=A0ABU2WGH9_9GAMM|nr:PaaI family thioesterase [Algiphilus sp. W345]MDT0496197.1 PaaI family thioesterase [Algiphilus sp. W345]